MVVLFIAIALCVAVGIGFFVMMLRRDEPHLGMIGMAALQVGGVLGTVFGSMTSI